MKTQQVIENHNRKKGVAGILRVKNDAEFIESCIDSCIDALDELIIVYNDCSDNSPNLIEKKRLQYPDKIKVYEYKPKIYSVNLSKEEYDLALNLPDDSPHLLCNYYNFALSKVSCTYAMKIDADQFYFTEKLKSICDFCRDSQSLRYSLNYWLGMLFHYYFLAYRFFSLKIHRRLFLMPHFIAKCFRKPYEEYAKKEFKKGNACLSLSGINVVVDRDVYVSLGKVNPIINILPPFNGENDHLIFKVSSSTYYRKFDMPYYNKLRSTQYSLIEEFVHPYKACLPLGFFWFHLNSMRDNCVEKVLRAKESNLDSFMNIDCFVDEKYSVIEKKTDYNIHSLFQRLLFSYIHNAYSFTVKKYLYLLKRYL